MRLRPSNPNCPEPGDAPVRLRRAASWALLPLLLAACGGGDGGEEPVAASPTPLASATSAPVPTSEEPEPTTDEATEETAEETTDDTEGADAADDAPVTDEPEVWATFTEEPGALAREDADEVFADDERVLAVRAFNEEFARAATANDPWSAQWLATMNPESHETLLEFLGEEFGKTYPGPLPFRVLGVADGEEDDTASVQGCIISEGFALGPEGVTGTTITSIEYALVQDPAPEGAWLVDQIWAGAYDCSAVDVEGRAW